MFFELSKNGSQTRLSELKPSGNYIVEPNLWGFFYFKLWQLAYVLISLCKVLARLDNMKATKLWTILILDIAETLHS